MEALHIKPTNYTPEIKFNPDDQHFEISGNSFPENSQMFYAPIVEWVKAYVQNPAKTTAIDFKLEYISSSSLKNVLQLLNIMKKIEEKGHAIEVNWFYIEDDEDIKDAGEKLSDITKLNFKMMEILEE